MLALCLFLSSCTKQKTGQEQIAASMAGDAKNQQLDAIIQQEAMLIDISIPLYDERIIVPSSPISEDGTLVFGYKSPLSQDQAINFFSTQMERLGWQHLVTFDSGTELIMQFASPDRFCTVIIKNAADTHSSIMIYIKKASS